jgi:hypothetical protein
VRKSTGPRGPVATPARTRRKIFGLLSGLEKGGRSAQRLDYPLAVLAPSFGRRRSRLGKLGAEGFIFGAEGFIFGAKASDDAAH